MAEHRVIFRAGAAKNGIAESKADEIFDLMEKFAGYGFNKSHAAAYSLLAYHTGWLKVHFTAEFFCANMTIELDDTDKLRLLHEDARRLGIAFEPPDVNRGVYRFEPVSDRLIRYGLGAIKGTGEQAIAAIVAAREAGGPFRSLFDFCARVDRARLNKRTVEALVKAGAFDALHRDRASLAASIDLAFDYAAALAANVNQGGLFDDPGAGGHGSSSQGAVKCHTSARNAYAPARRRALRRVVFCMGLAVSGYLAVHQPGRSKLERAFSEVSARYRVLCTLTSGITISHLHRKMKTVETIGLTVSTVGLLFITTDGRCPAAERRVIRTSTP